MSWDPYSSVNGGSRSKSRSSRQRSISGLRLSTRSLVANDNFLATNLIVEGRSEKSFLQTGH